MRSSSYSPLSRIPAGAWRRTARAMLALAVTAGFATAVSGATQANADPTASTTAPSTAPATLSLIHI